MKSLSYFGISSMKEGTSPQLSGRGELHGGARATTLVTLRKCTLGFKREIKILKLVLASTKGFQGGLGLDHALQERHGSDFFLLIMYTFGSAPLPAGLGPRSACWAAAPGCFVWLWVTWGWGCPCPVSSAVAALTFRVDRHR